MSSTRKPRSDSKLDALDLDQQRQLCELLLSGMSYEAVKEVVFKEFNVSTTSSALSSFYQSYCATYMAERRREAAGVARELTEEAARTPGQFDAAAMDLISQRAFEFASNPLCNPKDVKAIFGLMLKARDQELKEKDIAIKLRRLEMLESKESQAKDTLGDEKLNPEQKTRKIREIFGMA